MQQRSLMQQALGKQWEQLPQGLQAHYENDANNHNHAEGQLTIDYPRFMQWPLNLLRLMGALVNQRGKNIPTTVERRMIDGEQHWHRTLAFPAQPIHFQSRFMLDTQKNEFIEYTNRYLGLRMHAFVENEALYYESCGYVIRVFGVKIPLPEWLALGHARIVETAIDDESFAMDFRLIHPLLGEIFCYQGQFRTSLDHK